MAVLNNVKETLNRDGSKDKLKSWVNKYSGASNDDLTSWSNKWKNNVYNSRIEQRDIGSSANDLYLSTNNLIDRYNSGVNNYRNAQQTNDWLTDLNTGKSQIASVRQSYTDYAEKYGDDVSDILRQLDELDVQYDDMIKGVTESGDVFNQYTPKISLNGTSFTAEQMYNYTNRYYGKNAEEIQSAIDEISKTGAQKLDYTNDEDAQIIAEEEARLYREMSNAESLLQDARGVAILQGTDNEEDIARAEVDYNAARQAYNDFLANPVSNRKNANQNEIDWLADYMPSADYIAYGWGELDKLPTYEVLDRYTAARGAEKDNLDKYISYAVQSRGMVGKENYNAVAEAERAYSTMDSDLKAAVDEAAQYYIMGGVNSTDVYLKELQRIAEKTGFTEREIDDAIRQSESYFRQQSSEKFNQYVNEYATAHQVGATVLSYAVNPIANVEGNTYLLLQSALGETVEGGSEFLRGFNYVQNARGTVAQSLEKLSSAKIGDTAVLPWLYQAINSTVDSAINRKMTGVLGSSFDLAPGSAGEWFLRNVVSNAIMGSGAAVDAFIEAKQNGEASDRALFKSATAGFVEGLTETIGGETITDLILKGESAFVNGLSSFLSEGIEEYASNELNRAIGNLFLKENNITICRNIVALTLGYKEAGFDSQEAFRKAAKDALNEDISSFLAGGLSGLLMGTTGTYVQNARVGSDFIRNQGGRANAIANVNEQIREINTLGSGNILDLVGDRATSARIGKAVRGAIENRSYANTRDAMKEISPLVRRGLSEQGIADTSLDEATAAVTKGYVSKLIGEAVSEREENLVKLTEGEEKMLSLPAVKAATQELMKVYGGEITVLGDNMMMRATAESASSRIKAKQDAAEFAKGKAAVIAAARTFGNTEAGMEAVRSIKGNLDMEQAMSIFRENVREESNLNESGDIVLPASMGNSDVVKMRSMFSKLGSDEKETFSIYALQAYNNGANYGNTKVGADYLEEITAMHPEIADEIRTAYELGKSKGQKRPKISAANRRSGGARTITAEEAESVRKKNKLEHINLVSTAGMKKKERQRVSQIMQFHSDLGRAMGMNFVFYNSRPTFIKEGGTNGWFDSNTNTIYLDISAWMDNGVGGINKKNGSILFTTAHELTHFIASSKESEREYQILQDFIIDKLYDGSNGTFKDRVGVIMRAEGLTEEGAIEEIVAQSCENMLKNSTFVEELAERDMRTAQKINKFLRDFAKNFRAAVNRLIGNNQAGNEFAKELMKSADTMNEQQKLWDAALLAAVGGKSDGQEKESTATDGGVKRSAKITDSNGAELTEQQAEYFKDSKVRDANGNLLVVYHGTDADFSIFDRQKINLSNAKIQGFWFTSNSEYAEQYGKSNAYYIKISNPIPINKLTLTAEELSEISGYSVEECADALRSFGSDYEAINTLMRDISLDEYNSLVEKVKAVKGYDGYFFKTEEDTVAVVFDSNQAKLTTNLNPTENQDIRYSLKQYTDSQKENWGKSKKILIYESDKQLLDFVRTAKADGNYNKKIYFGAIGEDLAKYIYDKTGLNLEGRNVTLRAGNVRKEAKSHGNDESESLRGQRAVEDEDYLLIPVVIGNPDDIALSERPYDDSNGIHHPAIEFKKTVDNSRVTIIAVDSGSSLDLFVQTMYLGRKKESIANVVDDNSPTKTPKATAGTAPSESISSVKKSVKYNADGLTESEIQNADSIISRLKTTMIGSQYFDDYVGLSAERMSSVIAESAYKGVPDTAKSYIAWIDPTDFIYATTTSTAKRMDIKAEAGELDMAKLRGETQPIYLRVDMDTGEIIGHEGRHRLTALMNAGAQKVAVIIKSDKAIKNAQPIRMMKLKGQTFDERKGTDFYVHSMMPLSERYADTAAELFGKAKVKYSRKQTSEREISDERYRDIIDKQKKIIEDLKAEMKPGQKVARSTARKNARELRLRYRSLANVERLTEALEELYNTFLSGGYGDLESKADAAASIIFDSIQGEDLYPEADAVLKMLNVPMRPNEGQSAEAVSTYESMSAFRRESRLKLNRNADMSVDQVYTEIASEYPYLLDASISDADQLIALASLKDRLTYGRYATVDVDTEAAYDDIFTSVIETTYTVAPKETMNDRMQKRIDALRTEKNEAVRAIKAEYNAALKAAVSDISKQFKETDRIARAAAAAQVQYAKDKERLQRRIETERARTAAALSSGRETLRQYRMNRDQSEAVKKYRKRIEDKVKKLSDEVIINSDKKHIPEPLKAPLNDFIRSLNFDSKRLTNGGEETQKDIRFRERAQSLSLALQSYDGSDGYVDLPADQRAFITEQLNAVTRAIDSYGGDGSIYLMDAEQLKQLDTALGVIDKSVSTVNEFMANRRFAEVATAAQNSMGDLDSLGQSKSMGKILDTLKKIGAWDNATPFYAFRRMGNAANSMFQSIQDGWDKLALNSRKVIDFSNSVYDSRTAAEWGKEILDIELSEKNGEPRTVRMTVSQAMSLYCLAKRQQAVGHLLGGGIRVGDFEDGRTTVKQTDPFTLTVDDIARITSQLTDEQKRVADALQRYMNTVGSDWGNEISMARFGYKAFGELNYFPITSDPTNLSGVSPESRENDMFRLLNLSSTKSLTQGANNALMLFDIFDVFSNHMADMAKYNALALPVLDMVKWYNYKEKIDNPDGTHDTKTLQRSLERAFGTNENGKGYASEYIKTFIKDLNGSKSGGRDVTGLSAFMGRYKKAAVAANLRVAVQQPMSIMRAQAVIDPKWITKGIANIRSGREEMLKYSGMAIWKDLGFYDTNIGRDISEQIAHKDTVIDRIDDYSMRLAEHMDSVTWGALWSAAKAEQESKGLTGQALITATNERFRDIIYATQVVDSTVTRSDLMRNSSQLAKIYTSFMSEPTLTWNMMLDVFLDAHYAQRRGESVKGIMNKATRTAFALVANSAALAIVTALVDAWRDDDSYETFWEKFTDKAPQNFLDELNPIDKIAVISKAWDTLTSDYQNSSVDTAWLNDIKSTIDIIKEDYKLATDPTYKATDITYNGKMTAYGQIFQLLKTASDLSGIPMGSFAREAISAWNNLAVPIFGEKARVKTYNESPKTAGYPKLVDAILETDDSARLKLLTALRVNGESDKDISDGIKAELKERFLDGDVDETELADTLCEYCGYSPVSTGGESINYLIDSWKYGTGYKLALNLETAFAGGDEGEVRNAVEFMRTRYSYDDSKIKSAVTSYWKSTYRTADDAERKRIRALILATGLYDADTLDKQLSKWLNDN